MKKVLWLAVFVHLFFLAGTSEILARPPASRHAEGIVEKIDFEHKTLSIRSHSELLIFHWNDRTTFIQNDTKTVPDSLSSGISVDYWYRKPFFGEQIVTKVKWKMK